ncbi:MAG: nucleotidyltransferase domain-containing protein, partial [Planctomycetes bacterium]|nr:nucleotidyltransferase domain-containing protein [Planctomycetota bacterium]
MVAMKDIRAFARRIAEEFAPKQIILFGSYAYGTPTADSDVDLLVILAGRGSKADKSLEIRTRLDPRFPLDLLTRSAGEVAKRIAWNDWFLQEVMEK